MKKSPELFIFGLDGANTGYIMSEINEGRLPNFKRALDRGCMFDDCQPPFPSISTTGWVTFATGATPDVHGAVCEFYHAPGEGDPDELTSCYSGKNNCGEKLWEAAARAEKKSLVIDYCVTAECGCDNVNVVYNSPAQSGHDWTKPVFKRLHPSSCEIPPQFYVFDAEFSNLLTSPRDFAEAASGKWQPQVKIEPGVYTELPGGVYRLEVKYKSPLDNPHSADKFCWFMKKTESGAEFAFNESGFSDGKTYTVHYGSWSPVIRRVLKSDTGDGVYTFMIKLIKGEAGSFAVFISGSVDYSHISYPAKFAGRLSSLPLPPLPNSYSSFFPADGNLDTAFECLEQKCEYYRILLEDTVKNDPVDVMFTCLGYTDSINHMYQGVMSGVAEATEGERGTAREAYRRGYEMADNMLGWIYDNIISDDTLLCIVSDHGGVGVKAQRFPFDFFEEAGMFAWDVPEGKKIPWRERKINWEKTRAFPVSSSYICVNLKGRDPHGTVDIKDYDSTVQKIIDILHEKLRDDEGNGYLAFAVRREQAGFIRLSGPRCGDVVYGLTGSSYGGYIGGVHACQVPGAATSEFSSIRCLAILSGKRVKKHGIISRRIDLRDIAPTLCYMTGLPLPADSNGAVIFDAFK